MQIYVIMKRTFDTEEKVSLVDGRIDEEGVEFVINPYDEYALEEAISLKEKHGGDVTVITVGEEAAEKQLRVALAMGADKAVLIDVEGIEERDPHTTATLIAAYLKDKPFDLILGGHVAIDGGSGQVGPRLAERLNIPQVTTVTKLDVQRNKAVLVRDAEGDEETIETELPLLITAQQGLNEPRYPALSGIMKAKKKPLEVVTIDDLSIDQEEVAAKTERVDIYLPPKKDRGKMLDGEPREQVKTLVSLLKNEAKVI